MMATLMHGHALVDSLLAMLALWVLPGIGLSRALTHGAALSSTERAALALVLPPCVVGILGTLLAKTPITPLATTGLVASLGMLAYWISPSVPEAGALRWPGAGGRSEFVSLAIIGVLGLMILLTARAPDLGSDVLAHVAAVRANEEEARIFPEHEFHAPGDDPGVDPRFGTLHAFYAACFSLAGVEPLAGWPAARFIGFLTWALSATALCGRICRSALGRLTALFAFLGLYGGSLLNPFLVAPYPLWLGIASGWALVALLLSPEGLSFRQRVVLSGIILPGTAGIHALAYLWSAVLLAVGWITAPVSRRRAWLSPAIMALVISLPVVGLRFLLSYGNENPIHQRPWQVMAWAPDLFAANPVYLLGALTPLGLLTLITPLIWWSRARSEHGPRLVAVLSGLAIAWLLIPWLLTPSIKLLGFLPLRASMLVLFPCLLGISVESVERGAPLLRGAVFAALLVVIGASAVQRLRVEAPVESFLESAEWQDLLDHCSELLPPDAIVLSDPFTMLALKAESRYAVVAVPEGRSSPRDGKAIERLRDSWRALSPSTDGSTTLAALQRTGATHVLLNHAFTEDRNGYEYPLDVDSFNGQRDKLDANPEYFRQIWAGDHFRLVELHHDSGRPWNESYRTSCERPAPVSETTRSVELNWRVLLHDATVCMADSTSSVWLIDGDLEAIDAEVPDLLLTVRLDRVPSPVHPALRWVEKPVRKIMQMMRQQSYRYRWTVYPSGGRCPTWTLARGKLLPIDVRIPAPSDLRPGRYRLGLQLSDRSIFTPLHPADILRDADAYSGPALAQLEVDPRGRMRWTASDVNDLAAGVSP
jgi:hypothetical protein